MHDAQGKWVGYGLGDVDPKVAQIQDFLKRRYSARTKNLVATGTYDQATVDVVAGLQDYYKVNVPPGLRGVFTYNTQVATSFIKPAPKPRVPFFTVEGHLSDMMLGPVAGTAEVLEKEGRVVHLPTGYNNGAVPFDNKSGSDELANRIQTFAPPGVKHVIAGYSQGAIVVTDYLVNIIGTDAENDILGVLYYGNPTRSKGSVAPWSRAQAGPSENAGMDPKVRFDLLGLKPKFPIADVYRKGDIFSDNEPTKEGEVKSAIYQAAARFDFFSNPYSICSQIADLFTVPYDEVWGMFLAIISGIGFILPNQPNPHYDPFDLSGGINWVRSLLPA